MRSQSSVVQGRSPNFKNGRESRLLVEAIAVRMIQLDARNGLVSNRASLESRFKSMPAPSYLDAASERCLGTQSVK